MLVAFCEAKAQFQTSLEAVPWRAHWLDNKMRLRPGRVPGKKRGLNTVLLIEIWPRRLVCNQVLEPFEFRFHATQLVPKLALPLQ